MEEIKITVNTMWKCWKVCEASLLWYLNHKQIYPEENLKHRGWIFRAWPPISFFCSFYSPLISRSLLILPFVHQSCAFLISPAGMSSFALKSALTTPSKTYSYHNVLRATSSYNFLSSSPNCLSPNRLLHMLNVC